MTRPLRATLLVALATSFLPAVAVAQNSTVDSLVRRIEILERTTIALERRVDDLEALVRNKPSEDRSALTSPKWRDVQNWRRLRRGMTMDEVRALLGEPERVEALGGVITHWYWESGADLSFDGSDKLQAWSEPRG